MKIFILNFAASFQKRRSMMLNRYYRHFVTSTYVGTMTSVGTMTHAGIMTCVGVTTPRG